MQDFFTQKFKRVLFIAHREEILYQAKKSFKQIIPNRTGGIYNGKVKDAEVDSVFASIATLSMKQHLERFAPDAFDLIIIDEFHHAAANSYQRVLDYFTPQFLLGITATPDRNDNKDVYAICQGNVPFIFALFFHSVIPPCMIGKGANETLPILLKVLIL